MPVVIEGLPSGASRKYPVVFVAAVLAMSSAVAQNRASWVDDRKATVVGQLVSGTADITGYYTSPQAAWAAYSHWYNGTSGGRTYRAFNFRACADGENQYGYLWGTPLKWCHDFEITQNGQVIQTGFTTVISGVRACPAGTEMIKAAPISGAGGEGSPFIFETACRTSVPVADPRCCAKTGNPIDADSGAKQQIETDYLDPNSILTFTRSYNSRHGGFVHNFMVDFLPPVKGATASCTVVPRSASTAEGRVCSERVNSSGTNALFLTSQRHAYNFAWDGNTATPLLAYNKDRLIRSAVSGWILSRVDENRLLAMDAGGRLDSITSLTGRHAVLSYSSGAVPGVAPGPGYLISVADDFGRTLRFEYGDDGHLTRLIDPDGQAIQYTHEATLWGMANALSNASARVSRPSQVVYQDGKAVTYAWDEASHIAGGTASSGNLLTGIIDANGDRFATYSYDSSGTATSTEHAGSTAKYAIVDGRNSNGVGAVTVTDPLGTSRAWQFALSATIPRIAGRSQPAGSGNAAASSALTYDANGNIASRTGFNGEKSCHANDLDRNLEVARIEGLNGTDACPMDLGAYTIPAGTLPRKTTTHWHPDWSLPIRQAEPKQITTSIYNGQPDPTAGGATASCAPASALLPDGKPIAVLCKKVEQPTADATGSLGFSATPTGIARTWAYTYNQYGQMLTARDPRNKLTTYSYYADTTADHTLGDLQSVTNSMGRITQYTRYDKSGRLLGSIDPNGTVTDTTYTPRGWVKTVTVTPPSAAARLTVYDYDGEGQLKKATLPDAVALEYTYDAAHRLTGIKDNAGNSVTYTLDNMGNRKVEDLKDPDGTLARNITRVYDALNRVQDATGVPQ